MTEKLSFNRTDVNAGNLRMEGTYENIRNRLNKDLFVAMLFECFEQSMPDADDIMIAHHLTVVRQDVGIDAATGLKTHVEVVEEYPSVDTLLFDHEIARKLWGDEKRPVFFPAEMPAWKVMLLWLALEPVETRDQLALKLFGEDRMRSILEKRDAVVSAEKAKRMAEREALKTAAE